MIDPKKERNRRVLVTGAFGFIGRHVARRLARTSAVVVGIGHGNWSRAEWQQWGLSEWHDCDVTLDSLATYAVNPELIVHCAGSGSVAYSMSQPMQDCHRSVNSTLAVLEYIRTQAPGCRLVLPSSAGVYGAASRLPIEVSAPLNPSSPYGVHKVLAEELCRSYGRHFNVRTAIVRLFSVYGIGIRKQLLWDACSKLARGENRFFGTGQETRDWIHVEDAAELLALGAGHADARVPVVNGASGIGMTVRDILSGLAREFGVADIAFSGDQRPGDPLYYQASIAEALGWGWAPHRDLQEEIRGYAAWFKDGAP